MGYPPPPYPIDPRDVRPSRAWYLVATVIAVLGIVAAPLLVVLGFASFGSAIGQLPSLDTQFNGGAATTVELTAGKKSAIYAVVLEDTAGSAGATCTATPVSGGTIDLSPLSYDASATAEGSTWSILYEITVSQDGQYSITCTSNTRVPGTDVYAIGDSIEVGGFMARVFGGAGAFVGAIAVPCVGLFIALIIAIVTGVRRSSHKARLQRERMGYR
ncbi:hypothetical protein [Virgisporangium aliadipatigenens]|nr:hypothetical protein [Virgisporangium aliadipatigenens]